MLYFILSCVILWAFIKLLKMVLWLTLAVLFSVSLSWVCLLTGDLEGGPDGMDFDEDNNLLVAHWGSGFLEVFGSEGGSPHTRIKLPFAKVSNLHFKKGTKEVYVTEHDATDCGGLSGSDLENFSTVTICECERTVTQKCPSSNCQ